MSGVPAFAQSPPVTEPFTAQFEMVPASHNGVSDFTVHLVFSEADNLSFQAFPNGLLTITGGTLENQGRLGMSEDPPGSRAWRIDVDPDGYGEVTITLPLSQEACNPESVPCTMDGRPLYAPASVTVRGRTPWVTGSMSFTAAENQEIPTEVAPLTASDIKTPNGPFTWSIPAGAAGGADRDKFRVRPNTGVLLFTSAKDFENPDDADTDGIYAVTVQVRDGDSLTGTADLTVTLTNVNEAPIAEAGPNQFLVQPDATVTLSGSGSDPDAGDTLSYAWTQTGEPMVDADGRQRRHDDLHRAGRVDHSDHLDVQAPGDRRGRPVRRRHRDGDGRSRGPTAGHHRRDELDGRGEPDGGGDADGDRCRHAGRQSHLVDSVGPRGRGGRRQVHAQFPPACWRSRRRRTSRTPTTTDSNGIYAVTVEVSDGALKDTANLAVTLTDANDAPTADAGADQTGIAPGAVVTLSGSGSDPDAGDTLSYALDADRQSGGDADERQRGYGDLHRAGRGDRRYHLDVHTPGDGRDRPVPRGFGDGDGDGGPPADGAV